MSETVVVYPSGCDLSKLISPATENEGFSARSQIQTLFLAALSPIQLNAGVRSSVMAQLSHKKLAATFQRMAVSYSAGIDVRKIAEREAQHGSASYRQTFAGIAKKVNAGESLGASLAAAGGFFPVLATAVVRAGEQGGRLEESFRRLSEHYKSLAEFRQRFISKITWPVFQLIAAVGIVGGLILVLDFVYRLGNVPPIDWFGMGSTTGNFLLYCFCVAVVFGAAVFAYQGIAKGWFGDLPIRLARRIPLIGKTIESLALSRFAWTLSVCENAGMNPLESIRLALDATENIYYQQLEPELSSDLGKGSSFYESMEETGCFPEDLLMHVENGETAGELAESMDRASVDLQAQAENKLELISKIGFFMVFTLIAVVVGGTVILLFQNMYMKPINDLLG
jgi:type II secretory pathway component PulF